METVAAKIPPEMAEKIEEYRAERGLNTSQAMRALIDEGIESVEGGETFTFPLVLMWFGSLTIAVSITDFEVLIGNGVVFGLLLMVFGYALSRPELGLALDRLWGDRGEAS